MRIIRISVLQCSSWSGWVNTYKALRTVPVTQCVFCVCSLLLWKTICQSTQIFGYSLFPPKVELLLDFFFWKLMLQRSLKPNWLCCLRAQWLRALVRPPSFVSWLFDLPVMCDIGQSDLTSLILTVVLCTVGQLLDLPVVDPWDLLARPAFLSFLRLFLLTLTF